MGMEDEAAAYCNKGLGLGLGLGLGIGGEYLPFQRKENQHKLKPASVSLSLYFTLPPKRVEDDQNKERSIKTTDFMDDEGTCKTVSEFHNTRNNTISPRKKLRLTKEQSSVLEDSFQLHTTLNPAQKQALAEKLNLKPRQVEVWFQNRRARTRLKQTEINCEFLKKSCERLSTENTRLKKELQELRGLKEGTSPLYSQLPKAATLTMCPSCEKLANKSNS